MEKGLPALVAVTLAFLASACDVDRLLGAGGWPAFHEIGLAEAQRWLRQDGAILAQADEPTWGARGIPGAVVLRASKPLPDSVIQAGQRVLVLAHEPRAARRLAARLARGGHARVAVVRGGVEAWRHQRPKAGERSTEASG